MSRESEVTTPPLPEDNSNMLIVVDDDPVPAPASTLIIRDPSPPPPASSPAMAQEIKQLTNIVTEMRDSIFALNYQLQQQQQFIENVPSKKKALSAPPQLDVTETKTASNPTATV
jgi:hypothetical protein